ncbi:MAG: tRNA (adenosine(37)-N6)-dimethylallyltransferase MiaA [Candidatus Dormibacteraceae bacterium]
MTGPPVPDVVAVLGPTGVGKTEIAVRVAEALGGEVVVADSRQVYRGLEIATNKPSPEQRSRARFHMIDLVDPGESYDVHRYVAAARRAIAGLAARGRPVILEGGTGLYVDALLDGFALSGVGARPARRRELRRRSTPELAEMVRRLDPDARLDFANPVRLVRAIEVLEVTGRPLAASRGRRQPPSWRIWRIGLDAPRADLHRRLAERVESQLARGLVEETARALAEGVPEDAPSLTGIGYAESRRRLRGELEEALLAAAMRSSNRRYAKRQATWLRRDRRIRWFQIDPDPLTAILGYLRQGLPEAARQDASRDARHELEEPVPS